MTRAWLFLAAATVSAPVMAQDHDHHAGHTTAQPTEDPHAGHAMPEAQADPHAGHTMPEAQAASSVRARRYKELRIGIPPPSSGEVSASYDDGGVIA